MTKRSEIALLPRLEARVERRRPEWSRAALAGRLVELSGMASSAALTVAFGLVLEAQGQQDPAAWISAGGRLFFPPDVAETGVDLDALPVVRVSDAVSAARAADQLVRSGAFGLVVLDLGDCASLPLAAQARLVKLAQHHDTAVVCLTDRRRRGGSLGPLVSLRAEACRERVGDGRFRCSVNVVKDKLHGPRWSHHEVCRGPTGLR